MRGRIVLALGFVYGLTCAPAQEFDAGRLSREERQRLRRSPVVEVFQRCKDAVVNISTTQIVEVRSPFGGGGLFEEFFDLPEFSGPRRRYQATAVGSGFVIHSSGYIVTNAHVVARTAERKVIFADKTEYAAEIVAMDPRKDLAVLKIEADRPLERIPVGVSDDLMVGESVIAIGNPVGLETTVTAGVVSALDRRLEANGQIALEGLIQTDASINPGNSGGPLLNILGELIGITTAIRGDAQNIGFAIPVNQLIESLPELLDVERRYRIVAGLKVDPFQQARIVGVAKNSPADRAGLRVGDVLRAVNGKPLVGGIDYYIELVGQSEGRSVVLDIERDGARLRAEMVLAAMPKPDSHQLAADKLGMAMEPLEPALAKRLGLTESIGLVVTGLERGGPAAQSGVEVGDIVLAIGPHALNSIDDVGLLLEQVPSGAAVPLRTLRVGRNILYQFRFDVKAR